MVAIVEMIKIDAVPIDDVAAAHEEYAYENEADEERILLLV